MAKKVVTKNDDVIETVAAPVKESKQKYDGVEEITTLVDLTRTVTETVKVNLSDDEVAEFLKLRDGEKVSDYFKDAKIPAFLPKTVGSLLDDDAEEMDIAREVFSILSGYKIFYSKYGNKYTVLLPKKYSGLEKDVKGEYSSPYTPYDIRIINFPGGAERPSSYNPDYFRKVLTIIFDNVKIELTRQGISMKTV